MTRCMDEFYRPQESYKLRTFEYEVFVMGSYKSDARSILVMERGAALPRLYIIRLMYR